MATGEKPYRVYRGGRTKGRVPLERHEQAGNGATVYRAGGGDPDRRVVTRPKRRWSWKRWLVLGVVVLLLLAIVWGVLGWLSVRSGVKDANARVPAGTGAVLSKQNGLLLSHATNILVLGVDHSSLAARAGDRHSDSILLVRSDPSHHRIVYLSIPRDLRVAIPGHGEDKINAAMQIGGAPLAIRTVRDFTGLPVNHVVIVDFGQFEKLIDAVGGIDVNVPEPILSDKFDCPYSAQRCETWKGWRFAKGVQHMDARRALIYSRIRVNQLDPAESDLTRGERQQAVSQALLSKLVGFGTYLRLPFIGSSLVKPLATDLSTSQLTQLAWVKFRASNGNTLHCRLGGEALGDGYLSSSPHNFGVVQMVLGNSAPQPPPPGSGPFGPGCVKGTAHFK
jgi:LCP family protein required for cell wall assembly